jgi:hypothetical protein
MSEREKYLNNNVFVEDCATQKKTRVVRHGVSDDARCEVKWSGTKNVVKRNMRTCIIFAVMKLMTDEISQNNKRQPKVQARRTLHMPKVTARQCDTSRDSFIQIPCTYMSMRRSGFVLSARIARQRRFCPQRSTRALDAMRWFGWQCLVPASAQQPCW